MQPVESAPKYKLNPYRKWIVIFSCIAFLLIPIFTSPDFDWSLNLFHVRPFQRSFFSYVLAIILFFTIKGFLIPRFFEKKKTVIYFFTVVSLITIFTILPEFIFSGDPFEAHIEIRKMPNGKEFREVEPTRKRPFVELSQIILYCFVWGFAHLLLANEKIKKIKQQKTEYELAYLKSQLNPHFLFNSLNSIYALAIQKSSAAPDAIAQLASMMRYVLQESQLEKINASKEIQFVNDYISLQSLRLPDGFDLEINVDEIQHGKIAPMLLIPFIENAFKYGVNPEEKGKIIITIKEINDGRLQLQCYNHKVERMDSNVMAKNNIGIQNTISRLQNVYNESYTLNIEDKQHDYFVTLTIPI